MNPEELTGTLLGGRFRVGALLGAGGMGAVYDGVQEGINRRVALKVLHSHLAGDRELLARFEREARAVATLGHPNVIQINDFQTNPGEPPFIVMELLQGESLRDLLKRAPRLPPERVAYIAMQVLSALGAAHKANIVHRDVKPDNIFLSRTSVQADLVKVLDFGVAKLLGGDEKDKLTRSGFVVGTLSYMAPEQASGDPVDGRADLYSVGACMYLALAGRKPFDQPTTPALLKAILTEKPVPLAAVRQDVDSALAAIIDRVLAKSPEERFASAEQMADALAPFASPTPLDAVAAPGTASAPETPPTRAQAPRPATAATAARTPAARPATVPMIAERASAAPDGQRVPAMPDNTLRSPTAAVPSQPTMPTAAPTAPMAAVAPAPASPSPPVAVPAAAAATPPQPAAPVMPQRTALMPVAAPAPHVEAPPPVSLGAAPGAMPFARSPSPPPAAVAAVGQSPPPVVQRDDPPPARRRSPLVWVLVALGMLGVVGAAAAFLVFTYLRDEAAAAPPGTSAGAASAATSPTPPATTPSAPAATTPAATAAASVTEAPLATATEKAGTTHAAAAATPAAAAKTAAAPATPAPAVTAPPAIAASALPAAAAAAAASLMQTAGAPPAPAQAPGKKADKGPRTAAHLR